VANQFYILIVDDEDELRELLRNSLEQSYPAVVLQAKDGEEARLLLKACVFDLVIADIHMPHCDGVELFRWIMDHQLGLHENFIFLTAAGHEPGVVRRLKDLPPVRVLHKPFFMNELLEEVTRLLRRGAPSVRWPRSTLK
jgi:DNA-binding response OmpR family regulator